MQVDMHFYGVFCMARAAGMNREAAKTIAYASQYVDDSNLTETNTHDNGGKIISEATAHHTTDIKNINHNDQRYIWVPFHFYPSGVGVKFTDKLVCQKDSTSVNEMVDNHINQDKSYILELMGIAAHVYADTFSHYGFSGVSSRSNRVVGETIKLYGLPPTLEALLGKKVARWFGRYGKQGGLMSNIRTLISDGAELATGALGHGGVSIYPDQPYLKWEFEYEFKNPNRNDYSERDNQVTFLEACVKLYEMFTKFLNAHPEYKEDGVRIEIEKIIPHLKEILKTEGGKDERMEKWKKYAADNLLYNGDGEIDTYDSEDWHNQYEDFSKLTNHDEFANMNIYKFFQAASYHKHTVLRELLPKHGIIVI